MDFLFTNLFWGILIILIGVSVFLRGFNISLPLVKVFFAIIIIMFGVKLLIGGKPRIYKTGHHYSKGTSIHYSNRSNEYTMVFASGVIDLTDLPEDAKDLEITVVFGSATAVLPDDLNFAINPTSVFGSTVLPRQNKVSGSRPIEIESTAVFGRLEYEFKPRSDSAKRSEPADSTLAGEGF